MAICHIFQCNIVALIFKGSRRSTKCRYNIASIVWSEDQCPTTYKSCSRIACVWTTDCQPLIVFRYSQYCTNNTWIVWISAHNRISNKCIRNCLTLCPWKFLNYFIVSYNLTSACTNNCKCASIANSHCGSVT